MKYRLYILSMLVLSISFCAIEATTEDGKKVILHNNGTWKFENPAENAKFNLVEFKKARFESHDKNYAREEIPDAHVRGFFEFQNNSDRKIVAIKYKFAVTTVKGKAFLIKIFTPFEKLFSSSSLDKDIMCLIE